MTQVDFYLLAPAPGAASEASLHLVDRLSFTCRLVEKVYRLNKKIYIHSTSLAHAKEISKNLWTLRKESFLAHHVICENTEIPNSPIEIGTQPSSSNYKVMINLAEEVPSFVGRFDRVVELVSEDEDVKARARERYSYYRERGYPLKTHDLRS